MGSAAARESLTAATQISAHRSLSEHGDASWLDLQQAAIHLI